MMWMFLVLVYGLIKGAREVFKKKALEKNSVIEVLLVYTVLSFFICIPQAPNAMGLSGQQYFWVAVKAFVIFVAWIAGFKAIKNLPISLCGLLDLSRVLFASLLGIIVLGEKLTLNKSMGLVLVSVGLIALKFRFSGKNTERIPHIDARNSAFFVFLAFVSCILNAVSGLMDKILMGSMNSSQLQFWYILFMAIYYIIYAAVTRTKIRLELWKNVWIWLLAIGLVAMDKALFIANGMEESQITVMTLIKQVSVVISILAGKFVFKEKNMIHKFICASIIIAGIIVSVM